MNLPGYLVHLIPFFITLSERKKNQEKLDYVLRKAVYFVSSALALFKKDDVAVKLPHKLSHGIIFTVHPQQDLIIIEVARKGIE